jgi:hypothetical protein
MPDNPELRIVITGEDSAGKQAPAPQSGVDPTKPAPSTGPSPAERAGLDAVVAANLAALREAIGRNDKTSKEAVETLKILGSSKANLPGSEQYRALLESVIKGRINPPQVPASQPAAKLPETARVPRLPGGGTDASRREIIVLPRDQYTVDATQRGGPIGPPRPPEWRPPRLPSPGQPPANLPQRSTMMGGGFGGGIPPRLPGSVAPQGPLPPPNVPQELPQQSAFNLQNLTMFLGSVYFAGRIVGEFANAVRAATNAVDKMVERYGYFGPQTAATRGQVEGEGIIRDIQRAQRLDNVLAQYVRASFEVEQQWEDFKAQLLIQFGPSLIELLKQIKELIEFVDKVREFTKADPGGGRSILPDWVPKWLLDIKVTGGGLVGAIQHWINGDVKHKKNLEDEMKKRRADDLANAIFGDLDFNFPRIGVGPAFRNKRAKRRGPGAAPNAGPNAFRRNPGPGVPGAVFDPKLNRWFWDPLTHVQIHQL